MTNSPDNSTRQLLKKKVRYLGIDSDRELRRIKKWKFVHQVMSLGEELTIIDDLLEKGHILKVKQIYRGSMIYIAVEI